VSLPTSSMDGIMIRVAYEHFAETMTVHLSISLLGSLQVTLTGDPVTGFATDKTRALLAYLAIEAGRLHRRDALAGLLWPDEPQATARRNLRQALLFLRQALDDQERDPPFLLVDRETWKATIGWTRLRSRRSLTPIGNTGTAIRKRACPVCAGGNRSWTCMTGVFWTSST
jgi:hypothetical protein